MQVKKFEAKTMKEALDLVKVHLGPEAIILQARDNSRGFGLMGEKSVEVTAAVSEETLRKKKIAEAKLRDDLREQFYQVPAAKQKQFIDRVFKEVMEPTKETVGAGATAAPAARPVANPLPADVRAQLKGVRYIDIGDEEAAAATPMTPSAREQSYERVRRAVQMAQAAGQDVMRTPSARPAPRAATPPPAAQPQEMLALENQVRELKSLVERFQSLPQMPMSMHPGADQGLPFELSAIYQKLTAQGLQTALAVRWLRQAEKELGAEIKKPALVEAWLVRHLLNSVEISADPNKGRYQIFTGTTGQGKTTSLVKQAAHLVMKERKRIAIVSLDTVKVGAADQLRLYAQILNVPFAIVRNPEEWRVAEQKLNNVHHILVDCPGFNLRTQDEVDWLRRMLPPDSLDRAVHFVQSILARDEETLDLAARYQAIGIHDVIFTRLDEASRHGLILNFQDKLKVPVHAFAFGTKVPEDYEFASKERVVDFLFKLTKHARRGEI